MSRLSGNMVAKQGLEHLAQAARWLAADCPPVVLILCGSGPMRPMLEVQRFWGQNLIPWVVIIPVRLRCIRSAKRQRYAAVRCAVRAARAGGPALFAPA